MANLLAGYDNEFDGNPNISAAVCCQPCFDFVEAAKRTD